MIGVDMCHSNKKLSMEQQVCYLATKVNELIEGHNDISRNQVELEGLNNQVYTAMKLWQTSQLQFLNGIVIKSPNGTLYKVKVADDGTLSTEVSTV